MEIDYGIGVLVSSDHYYFLSPLYFPYLLQFLELSLSFSPRISSTGCRFAFQAVSIYDSVRVFRFLHSFSHFLLWICPSQGAPSRRYSLVSSFLSLCVWFSACSGVFALFCVCCKLSCFFVSDRGNDIRNWAQNMDEVERLNLNYVLFCSGFFFSFIHS